MAHQGNIPSYNNQNYTHRPKLEDDYRNKNIHKVKRMHGSSVVSPGTEKALHQQNKMFKRETPHNNMGLMSLQPPPPIGLVGKSRTMQPMMPSELPELNDDKNGSQYKRMRVEEGNEGQQHYHGGGSFFGQEERPAKGFNSSS